MLTLGVIFMQAFCRKELSVLPTTVAKLVFIRGTFLDFLEGPISERFIGVTEGLVTSFLNLSSLFSYL